MTTPLLTKEAVLSSRIEGTQATLEDVFKYEAEEKISEKEEIERGIKENFYLTLYFTLVSSLKKIEKIIMIY